MMQSVFRFVFYTIAFSVAIVASAVDPHNASAESLTDALVRAYNTNPTLKAKRAETRAVDEGVPQALSNFRPTVEFTGDYSRVENTSSTRIPTFGGKDQLRFSRGIEASVRQPLFRGFRSFNQTDEAVNRAKAAHAGLMVTEQDVLLQAVIAYMNVVRDQAVLKLTENNVNVLENQLQAARDRFEVGDVTRTDVSQAEARVSGAIAERVAAEGDLKGSRATYQSVIGNMPGTLENVEPVSDLPETQRQAIERARNAHPSIISARFNDQAAEENVNVVKGELLPEVNLEGSIAHSRERSRSGDDRARNVIAGLTLRVPIYQGGRVYSRLRQAKHSASQARLGISVAERSVIENLTRAWEQFEAAKAQIDAFAAQVEANELALDGVKQEALVGSRTTLDILDAEQELLNSQVNLVRARRDTVVASFELKSAIGELTAAGLKLPVNYYEPIRHYDDVYWDFIGGRVDGDEEYSAPQTDTKND